MPLGQTKSNFNFNLDEKRVLNFENEVSDSDNIKQDMSIDVYGRKDDEDKEEPKAAAKVEVCLSSSNYFLVLLFRCVANTNLTWA